MEELIIMYSLDFRVASLHVDTGPLEPRPIRLWSLRCSVWYAASKTTILTGLFITAKLFVEVAFLNAGPLRPHCLFAMYVVIIVLHTKECALILACVVHAKVGP